MCPYVREVMIEPAARERFAMRVLAQRAEDILAEVASALWRLRTLVLVVTITIPLFLAGLVALLWHFAH